MPEFPCPRPVQVTVKMGSGTLMVTAEERDTADVEVKPTDNSDASRQVAADTQIDMSDDRLLIEVPQGHSGWILRRSARIRVELRLPLDSVLYAKLGSTDVHGEGRLGAATITSGSGDVYLAEVNGDVSIKNGSGDIRIDRIGGELRTESGSGDVTVGHATGPVQTRAASGDVYSGELAGAGEASTASGDITVGSIHSGRVALNAASGDIKVGVHTGTKVWLDLQAQSGDTVTDLAVRPDAPEGGVQASLQVRTMSGDIHVHSA